MLLYELMLKPKQRIRRMKKLIVATTAIALLAGSAYAAPVQFDFRSYSREPKKFAGNSVVINQAKVIQVIENDDDEIILRVSVTKGAYGFWTDTVYITYTRKSEDEPHILDGDFVKISGEFKGLHSYSSVMAGKITIPH